MDKETKDNIKKIKNDLKGRKLSKDEKMDYCNEIYRLYGINVYKKVTPRSIKRKDIKNLLRSGRFDDIYFKYGEETYKEKLDYMKSKDIEYETGKKHLGTFSRVRNFIKKRVVAPLLGMSILLPSSIAVISIDSMEDKKSEEEILYKEQIEEYIENTKEYADSVSDMNLSQLETLMKLTDDMWNNIKGYGTPKLDLIRYTGLDLATQDGVGVCRNMADDIARKLNLINENYNARTLTVYMEGDGYKLADIEQKIVEEGNKEETTEEQGIGDETLDKIVRYTGNHKIVVLDSIEENATLILDPTNPGIGIIKNGKITMFNSIGDNKLTLKVTPIADYIMGDNRLELREKLLETYKRTDLTLEQLQEKYSVEAQNRALETVREKGKTFKDTIKIRTKTGENIKINLPDNFQDKNNSKNESDFIR